MKGYSTQHVLLLLFVVVVLLWACNEERDQVTLTYYMPAPPSDAGQRVFPEPTPEPELTPPTDQCDENAIRCLASHSDRIEACRLSEDGETTRWIQDRCSPGFVCVDNACTTFSCIPERPTCDGLYTRGICNAEGDALNDPTPCEGDEVCRGGSCIDLCASAEQTRSYIGCEYMAVELPNPELELDEPFGLVVANTDPLLDAVLTVYGHNGEPSELIDTVTITRNRGREDEERVESHIEDASG
ncbi:MAG: hypothetical protein AAFS10_13445, partial [Myxococcota bacterium]